MEGEPSGISDSEFGRVLRIGSYFPCCVVFLSQLVSSRHILARCFVYRHVTVKHKQHPSRGTQKPGQTAPSRAVGGRGGRKAGRKEGFFLKVQHLQLKHVIRHDVKRTVLFLQEHYSAVLWRVPRKVRSGLWAPVELLREPQGPGLLSDNLPQPSLPLRGP